jgi:hypothetical protein
MKKLTFKREKEGLENALKHYGFDDNYFILPIDGRLGLKYAIASKTEFGGLQTHTNYMTYDAFNAYLFGYDNALKNLLVKK